MNEFRLDPGSLSFTLLTRNRTGCPVCASGLKESASLPFRNGMIKVYEMMDDVQPSKYELNGQYNKSSPAHGYEELIVDSIEHGDKISSYSVQEIEALLKIVMERVAVLEKYQFGENIIATRYLKGHGLFDLVILPIPSNVKTSCSVCEALSNTANREILRTENTSVYFSFAPAHDIDISVSPIKHTDFESLDSVVLFDISAAIKKTIDAFKQQDITLCVVRTSAKHVEFKVYSSNINPFTAVGINKAVLNPEETAKELRSKISL